MSQPSQPLPTLGQPNSTEDPKIRSALSELQTILISNVDETNLTTVLLQRLGLTTGAQVGRGKVNIVTTESRTNVAYGLMPTPDRVTGVVLPTDGLICVAYQATWQESVAAAAQAAIFIGANQLKGAPTSTSAGNPIGQVSLQFANTNAGTAATDMALATHAGGLASQVKTNTTAYGGDVTTGQLVGLSPFNAGGQSGMGGPCYIFAAAGTYDISIQFNASSGSVTVKNRHLWVWTISF